MFNIKREFFTILFAELYVKNCMNTLFPRLHYYSRHFKNSLELATRTNLHALSQDFEKIITSSSLQLRCFFIGLNESSHRAGFSKLDFFFKISNYFKSYHGKTKILKFCPFFEKLLFLSPCYCQN